MPPESKSKGGRPQQKAEYDESPASASRFFEAVKVVLDTPKKRVVALESKAKARKK